MKKTFLLSLLFYLFSAISSFGFQNGKLFKTDDPLPVKMAFSVKELKKTTNDSTFMDSFILIESSPGKWDSIPMEMRTRGNFRLDNCFYPPIRLKFKKKGIDGTVFEKNKSLKLVMPCQKTKGNDSFIGKEFLAYQLLEDITQYNFETRLVKIKFINLDDKKAEEIELLGFFIQDDDEVADRFDGKILEGRKIPPSFMQDSATVRQDFFQFMIGNTDFSTLFLHNQKVLQLPDETVIPLAYDFDMSGLVNPPYAQVNTQLGIKSITDRLYRGFCRDEAFLEMIRQEFLAKENQFWSTVDRNQAYISEVDLKATKSFLSGFFDVLKNDRLFKEKILQSCRSSDGSVQN
ncbi:hypothetical protein [Algoriphagus litoralis]|uniref:hypothetical protein n=1 Tax=Algoriphagus litoralis TaxID=2202829 RepID=UPI000DBA5D8F|nr:hypothetical protein [Algoriphagus litoralis]